MSNWISDTMFINTEPHDNSPEIFQGYVTFTQTKIHKKSAP